MLDKTGTLICFKPVMDCLKDITCALPKYFTTPSRLLLVTLGSIREHIFSC